MATIMHIYESAAAFMALEPSKTNKDLAARALRPDRGANWYGIEGAGPAITAAIAQGWPDGVKRAREIAAEISMDIPPAQDIRRRKVRGDHGDEIDMQRVYAGALDTAWSRTARRSTNAPPVISIFTNFGGTWAKSGEEMFYKGAAAAVLADILEAAGYRVEIICYGIFKGVYENHPGQYDYFEFPAKRADEPLDLNRLTALTALAGTLRIMVLRPS